MPVKFGCMAMPPRVPARAMKKSILKHSSDNYSQNEPIMEPISMLVRPRAAGTSRNTCI